MRKVVVGLLGASLVGSVGIMLPAWASAAQTVGAAPAAAATGTDTASIDDLPSPLEDKRRALREQAVADDARPGPAGRLRHLPAVVTTTTSTGR